MMAAEKLPESSLAYELNKHLVTSRVGFTFVPGTPLRDVEKEVILKTLRSLSGNRTHTARVLEIGIRTLQRKLKKYFQDNPMLEKELAVS